MKLLYVLLLVFCIDKLAGQFNGRCIYIEDDGINITIVPGYIQRSYNYYRSWSLVVGQDELQSSESTKELCVELITCRQTIHFFHYLSISLDSETPEYIWNNHPCRYALSTDELKIEIDVSLSSITLNHICNGGAQVCITDNDGTMPDKVIFRLGFDKTRSWAYRMTCSKSCEVGTTAGHTSSARATRPGRNTTSTITPLITQYVAGSTLATKTVTSESTTRVTSPLSSLTNATTGSSTNRETFSEGMSMSTTGEQSRRLTQPAVIGISVAAVVIIGLIIALLVILLLRKRASCSKPSKKDASPARELNGQPNAVISAEYSVVLKHDEDTATYRATPGAMYQHPGASTPCTDDPDENDEYYQGDFEFHGPEADADNRSELSYELARTIPNSDSHARNSNADNIYGNLDECGDGVPANIREGTDPELDSDYNRLEENTEDPTYYNVPV